MGGKLKQAAPGDEPGAASLIQPPPCYHAVPEQTGPRACRHHAGALVCAQAWRLGRGKSGRIFQGRDHARIYVKELDRGRAPIALSPEETEVVERAMSQ